MTHNHLTQASGVATEAVAEPDSAVMAATSRRFSPALQETQLRVSAPRRAHREPRGTSQDE